MSVEENAAKPDGETASKWRFQGEALDAVPNGEHPCSHPLAMLNVETGELVNVRCGTRSEKKCPGCAWVYKKDTAKILRSGLLDDGACRYFFLTLTAPSFGATHNVPKRGERKRCRCGAWHDADKDMDLRGVPLDCDEYDYSGQAYFNYRIGGLWNTTLTLLRKWFPDLCFAKVYEWQQRGALHVHIILRIPAADFLGKGDAESLLKKRASSATCGGWMHWGSQNDCREIRGGVSSDKVIGYLKKAVSYVTKDVCEERPEGESRNKKHLMMLDEAARMMRCDKCLAKRAELIADLEQRSLSEKREAIRTEMRRRIALGGECDAEIPLYLQVCRFEEERRLSVKVRFYRLLSGGCLECDSLPHRRWGARSGVMSVSRRTRKRMGWSATDLTRKLLAERRHTYFVASMNLVRETAQRIIECAAGSTVMVPG